MTKFNDYLYQSFKNSGARSHVLLVGEDHTKSSALIALADAVKTMANIDKKIVIITEDLPEKSKHGREATYSAENVKQALPEYDKDRDALLYLIKQGASVFGLENKQSAPGLFLKGKSKQELYNEARKKLPSIFVDEKGNPNPQMEKNIKDALNDSSYDVQGYKDFLNRRYSESNARIQDTNKVASDKIAKLVGKNPVGTAVIFCGGAAHIPKAKDIKDANYIVDIGINQRVAEALPSHSVSDCFVTSDPVKDGDSHTPKDPTITYDSITTKLSAPKEFINEASSNLESSDKGINVFKKFKNQVKRMKSESSEPDMEQDENKENISGIVKH